MITLAQRFEQKGMERGMEQGMEQGLQEGRLKAMQLIAAKLFKDGMPIGKIAQLVELPTEFVGQFIAEEEEA